MILSTLFDKFTDSISNYIMGQKIIILLKIKLILLSPILFIVQNV